MSNRKLNGGANAKGYYIALVLCAVAIGISGYLYYRNDREAVSLSEPDTTVAATQPMEDVAVVATKPQATEPAAKSTQPAPATQPKALVTVSPVEGEVIAVFAMEELQYNQTTRDWRTHNGMDIAAQEGSQVCAAAEGEVYTVYEDDTMGTTVVLRHADGYTTRYASLSQEVLVEAGDKVSAGQAIGTVGNTALLESAVGSHLHFSVSCNDEPMDPAQFLNQA